MSSVTDVEGQLPSKKGGFSLIYRNPFLFGVALVGRPVESCEGFVY